MLPNMDTVPADPVPEWDAVERRHRRWLAADRFCVVAAITAALMAGALPLWITGTIALGGGVSRDLARAEVALLALTALAALLGTAFRNRADALWQQHFGRRRAPARKQKEPAA